MNTILVQLSEYNWTIQAMHLACALARSNQTNLIVLRLDHVTHPANLGTEFGQNPPGKQEIKVLEACAEIAEQYSVPFQLAAIQCATTEGALLTAVDEYYADILFAPVSITRLPVWHKVKTWNFVRRLSALDCQLFTLDKTAHSPEQPLSIEITPVHISSGK